jgi:hypothetical protein
MRSSRSNRPSLIGTAARTAVIAGTATAVSGKVATSQHQKAAAAQAQAAAAASQAAAEQPAASAAAGGLTQEAIERLKQLGELHQAGLLSDEEFAAAKAKLLDL